MGVVLDTIVPVWSVIAIGYVLAARRQLHVGTLSDLAILVTSPALMFRVLAETPLEPERWAALAGGTLWIAAGGAVLAVAYLRTAAPGRRGLLLPAIFWNAGNMLLPTARLAFGPDGLEAAAIIFVIMAVLTSTFGIWIAKGENGLAETLRLPLVYGSVGGLVLAVSGAELPRMIMEPIDMLAAMAIPVLLLNLGVQLKTLQVTDLGHLARSRCHPDGRRTRVRRDLRVAIRDRAVRQPGPAAGIDHAARRHQRGIRAAVRPRPEPGRFVHRDRHTLEPRCDSRDSLLPGVRRGARPQSESPVRRLLASQSRRASSGSRLAVDEARGAQRMKYFPLT